MRFPPTRLLAVVVATTLAVAIAAFAAWGSGSEEAKRNPVLAGELLAGGTYDPAAHKGKVTVVNFWGSWCAPCRAEMPGLVKAYAQLHGDDVAFLGVNIRDPNIDLARAFVDQYEVPFPSIRDPQSKLALEFEIPPNSIPATLILGRNGRPARTYRAPVLGDDLVAAVREVLADG